MPVLFNCQQCHQPIRASRRKGGTMVACPHCGQPNMVPTAPAALAKAEGRFVAGAGGFDDIPDLIAPPVAAAPAPVPVFAAPPSPPLPAGMPSVAPAHPPRGI